VAYCVCYDYQSSFYLYLLFQLPTWPISNILANETDNGTRFLGIVEVNWLDTFGKNWSSEFCFHVSTYGHIVIFSDVSLISVKG